MHKVCIRGSGMSATKTQTTEQKERDWKYVSETKAKEQNLESLKGKFTALTTGKVGGKAKVRRVRLWFTT